VLAVIDRFITVIKTLNPHIIHVLEHCGGAPRIVEAVTALVLH
jgi:hypothetical protein